MNSTKNVKDFVEFETRSETLQPKYPLHSYQRQVLADILIALSSGERRVVAHLPTGAGKTRVATHAACHLLNKKDADDSIVIWLASTEELCEQAADELSRAWTYLGMRDARIHRYWGNWSLNLRNLASGFLVCGLAKLRATAFQDHTILAHLAQCVAAVIFDEAHQAIAHTYSFMTEQLCSVRPPLLGLTATPGRTANFTDSDYRLANMFGYNKVSIDSRGHDNPVTYLIQNQYLADVRLIPIDFESNTDVTNPDPGVDYSQDDLENIGRNHHRTCKIVELTATAAKRYPRTIVFCPSVGSALECNKLLQIKGIRTHTITANTPSETRRGIIDAFRSDDREHMVIFNYGVLTAGFDAPRTRCVIIARPTTSLVLYSQMAGRAMRGPRAGGNSKAEVFTVADTNLPGFGAITDAFTNWEELWSTNSPT